MTDFQKGMSAPDFTLSQFTLSKELQKGPLLLTFYKKTCPTCQFTYPFFERIHKHYMGKNFQVVGIAQDPETKEFSTQVGVTFPLICDTPTYEVSRQYHLTNVPTAFLVLPDGNIDFLTIGFLKKELEELSRKISNISGNPLFDIFPKGDNVPEFKPG
ncbi:MAG: TlpA family protein disulfide reductase [Deltaproteobacteria bacterium]|nr:TlpA family protein disulfide reductase [Deltaproteobacteria bacterium]